MTGGRPAQAPDHLVRMIYGTLAEQDLWPAVMEQICGLFDAEGASLIHHDFGAKKGYLRCHCDHVAAASDAAYNGAMNCRNPWLHSDMPYRPDTVFLGTEILPDDELVRTEFYRAYLRPLGLQHRLCGVVARDGLQAEFVTILRRRGTRSFGSREKARLKSLLPHLSQALSLQSRLLQQQEEHSALFEMLDHIPVACLLLNQGCRVRFMNHAAQALMARRDGLMLRAGQVVAALKRETTDLRCRVAQTAAKPPTKTVHDGEEHLVISRGADQPPLLLTLFPVDRRRMKPEGQIDSLVAVLTKDPEAEEHGSIGGFAEAYGLTPAEERLITLLAGGHGLFQAARALGVTRNTARTHIRHVYGKVGVHRQADIIRLLGKLSVG